MSEPRAREWAIFRFSLYGFLKNQQYYEPFLFLAFLEKGLTFFSIGLLIGFRGLCIYLLEIPTGAIADIHGRRRSMMFSFSAFIVSFIVFAISETLWTLYVAMFLFAVGDAFRTGTHKAMIFSWLRSVGREDERSRIYGYTRSWSKMGSALSAIIAASLVFWRGNYSDVFLLCAIPYAIGLINFIGYPKETEAGRSAARRRSGVLKHLWRTLRDAWRNREERALLVESFTILGVFKGVKDYLQPLLMAAAVATPLLTSIEEKERRTAVLVGAVYVVLHLLASVSSRYSHRVAAWAGGDAVAGRWMWLATVVLYALMAPMLAVDWVWLAIPAFVMLYPVQNLWRPTLLARLDACSDPDLAATTLSIDAQLQALFVMIVAPTVGFVVDRLDGALWPVGVLGAVVVFVVPMVAGRTRRQT